MVVLKEAGMCLHPPQLPSSCCRSWELKQLLPVKTAGAITLALFKPCLWPTEISGKSNMILHSMKRADESFVPASNSAYIVILGAS